MLLFGQPGQNVRHGGQLQGATVRRAAIVQRNTEMMCCMSKDWRDSGFTTIEVCIIKGSEKKMTGHRQQSFLVPDQFLFPLHFTAV